MNTPHEQLYTANQLAEEFGTTARALRFYETKGLLAPRRAGVRRVYDYRDRARLMLVLRGKRLGFSLAQVKEYLSLYEVDTSKRRQLAHLRRLVTERLEDLELRREAIVDAVAELEVIAAEVERALSGRGPRGDKQLREKHT